MVRCALLKVMAIGGLLVATFSCKTAETMRTSPNEMKEGTAPSAGANSADTKDTSGRKLTDDEIARVVYERARLEIEGGANTASSSEVRSLLAAEAFKFLVIGMEAGGKPVAELKAADLVKVQIEGTYIRTTDVYENPEGPEDACLAFTAAAGVRKAGEGWEVPTDDGAFKVLGESATECL